MSAPPTAPSVVYPDSDDQPMADGDIHYRWLTTLKDNLEDLFRDRPDVYVAGDHLIYPVEGDPKVRQAPDVYVAFGRPKRDRGSYQVWEEGGVFPQVVIEVRSPGNRAAELARKLTFYDQYGAEEYYLLDPIRLRLTGYHRVDGQLDDLPPANVLVSPRLGVRFELSGTELVVTGPDGQPFRTARQVRDAERAERQRADTERQRAEAAEQQAAELLARLRALGGDVNGH